MRAPRIDKLVINIGVGEGGEKLQKAVKVLEMLTKQTAVKTISKTLNREWGLKKGGPIGCKVTLRGARAEDFLKKALWITQNKVSVYAFDREGNFSIGIKDYTDFEGLKYDPEIGTFGMDICVTMGRKGIRVTKRRKSPSKLPRAHRLKPRESIEYIRKRFSAEVIR